MATTATQPVADPRSDEELLSDHRHGDKTTFPLLVQRYQKELFNFLVRFVGDRQLADDVFQEAFLQVHQSAAAFDTTRRFKPWLFAIAANKARDMLRTTSRKAFSLLQATIEPGENASDAFVDIMSSTISTPDENLEKKELRQKVQSTVMSMPEMLREVLLLCFFHQFPYKQVSEMLDIPLGTVKSRVSAGLAYFADEWQKNNSNLSGS